MAATRIRRRVAGWAAIPAVLVLAGALLAGCGTDFPGLKLRIAAGNPGAVYYTLAQTLATAWAGDLDIDRPEVLTTQGTPDNIAAVQSGRADVAFVAADVATDPAFAKPGLVALARIHDDYLHVVVRADSTITSVAQLKGKRLAIGSPESGVEYIAKRLLAAADLSAPGAVELNRLDLKQSLEALVHDQVDALFWSGGLPTPLISQYDANAGLHMLDISDLLPKMQQINPVYGSATIPASTYGQLGPVTTLVVPNFLVVRASMPDDLAGALVSGLFGARAQLAKANPAALSIDVHPGIETAPIPLHPGALKYYRNQKP